MGRGYPILDGYGDGTINSNPSGIGYGFGVEVGTGLIIPYPYPYPTFGYRGKPEPEPIPGQLGYYPSKSGRIRAGTHGYGFSCHVYFCSISYQG